jgi:hypothetical protein
MMKQLVALEKKVTALEAIVMDVLHDHDERIEILEVAAASPKTKPAGKEKVKPGKKKTTTVPAGK